MDSTFWAAIIGAVTALVAALGVFMARSGFSGVIRSGTQREETAVGQMANLLEKLAVAQIERETYLLQIQDKALDTVAHMTETVTAVAVGLDAHGNDTRNYVSHLGAAQERILTEVQNTREDLTGIGHLLTDLGTEVIRVSRWLNKEANGKDMQKTP